MLDAGHFVSPERLNTTLPHIRAVIGSYVRELVVGGLALGPSIVGDDGVSDGHP